jgi:hypothetical protein
MINAISDISMYESFGIPHISFIITIEKLEIRVAIDLSTFQFLIFRIYKTRHTRAEFEEKMHFILTHQTQVLESLIKEVTNPFILKSLKAARLYHTVIKS